MDDESTSGSYSKELFKSSYKFINFKKQSSEKQCEKADEISETSNETIGEFYRKLIKTPSSYSIPKSPIENSQNIITKNEKSLKEAKQHLNPKEFLKAAQTNDLDFIQSYLKNGQELNVVDNFKWNALMISTASSNNQIVNYLLNEQKINSQYNEMVYMKDDSGNDAELLATKFNNVEALELIRKAKDAIEKTLQSDSLQIKDDESGGNKAEIVENFYCKKCRKLFDNTNEQEHVKSIAHQLNEMELEPCSSKTATNNLYLRSSNKGYQLLLKSGWNESSGLGKEEQGELKPIKTKLKLDRLGLGIEAPSDIPKSKSKLIQLKTAQYDERIESKFKRTQKAKHKSEKSKNFEKKIRSYFNN